ncbi:hypothetical protein BDN72DRAFT_835133 [Pluteus cervinus]|uniref:Uncharacterized protein n=1 Tax=Pluteus cervinus TaxID=181527 RepID=A0ACD3B5E8_9AGAR|nr:hypothetical protein BDN72DRAFT_835133 [Pluteus cervinus]
MTSDSDKDSPPLVAESSSAALRALQIVDIVQEILGSLYPRCTTLSDYRAFISTRKTLLHTALTCHTFLEPCLDVLWRSMHSIFPLLKLLPTEFFRERNGEYILNGFADDESASSNWPRVQYYGLRIKNFYYDPASLPFPPLPFHTCIAIPHFFHSSLLPNLDTLHIGNPNRTYDSILFAMTASPLRHIEIRNLRNKNTNLVDSFLICLREKSHNIQDLTLEGVCPPQFPQSAKHLTGLISLDLTQTFFEESMFQLTMQNIARLPVMKAIKLRLDPSRSSVHQLPQTVWSTSMEHLTLNGSVSQIAAFLNNHVMRGIRDIQLDFQVSPYYSASTDQDWSTFKDILSLMVSRWPNMRKIVLGLEQFTLSSISYHTPSLAFREIVQSLTDLTQLKNLRINLEKPVAKFLSLTNADYWELANAFPLLEHLALPLGNIITFDALYKLALLCPRLRSIAVGIDTETIPALLSSRFPAISHDLEVLSVGDSPLNNIHHVTRHLHRLFPCLEMITATNSAWDPVRELLVLYKTMVIDHSERREVTQEFLDHLKAEQLSLAS